MAAVSERLDRAADAESRAQIILVGGLALAVTLLVLAVVLNSAIYTENLATRSREAGPASVVDLRGDVRDGVGGVVEHVNRAGGGDDFGTLQGSYGTALDDWRPMVARQLAVRNRIVGVSRAGEMEGTRIVDADPATTFEPRTAPAGGGPLGAGYATPNWLVATDVRVRAFRFADVAATDLATSSPGDPQGSGAFYVEVRDTADADAWRVALYEDGGDVAVTVYDVAAGSVVGTCTTGESTARVDLTGATLDARPCDALGFLGSVTGTADVYFVNADDAAGTYELTVDRAGHGAGGPLKDEVDAANYGVHCDGPTYFDDPGSGSPSATAGVYSATVEMRYDDRSLTYESDVRAAPGEPGDEAVSPVVTEFTVTDSSDGTNAVFDLSWTTADPNGDAVSAVVTLHNLDDGTTNGYAVAGGSATISESGDHGDRYEVTLTASDGSNDRSVTETHVADGDDDPTDCPP